MVLIEGNNKYVNMDEKYIRRAIELARQGMEENAGGPFGAVIVKGDQIIAESNNTVTSSNDPTAHAEVNAIRQACEKLSSYQLEGCALYSSCEPCPMCLGAIYWARPDRLVYSSTRIDAANIGFDDAFIYEEILNEPTNRKIPTKSILREEANLVFVDWNQKQDKIEY